jgi:ABC-type sugar transport system ATPase subunit/ribose/xylose/arabinose/galactoside ABC-type transport system permease subunit
MSDIVLALTAVTKTYPGVVALRDASLEVRAGEIHALVGENGAGKSTLMGIASGATLPDAGSVDIAGRRLDPPTPQMAERLGLAIVYQRPALVPDLTVAENLVFAAPPALRPSRRDWDAWAQTKLTAVGGRLRADAYVRDLSVADRQIAEIARALSIAPKLLILDEPTEPLVAEEIERLFENVRAVAARGAGVVYISHRIPEVMRIADRITVLRDGETRGTFDAAELSEERIVNLIAGRSIEATFPDKRDAAPADAALTVESLSGDGFHDVDLTVAAGEIVGVAGVEGNGQEAFIRALAGARPVEGDVRVRGEAVRLTSPRAARAHGIVYVAADRHAEGLFLPASVADNITATSLADDTSRGVLLGRRQRRRAAEQVARLGIKAASVDDAVESLSGGNQQKVAIARALAETPRVLLLDEPTHGVDIASRVEIYRIAREAANRGAAVVVRSSDGLELEGLCDRVAIFSRGHVAGELQGAELTERALINRALTATGEGRRALGLPERRWRLMPFLTGDFMPALVLLVAMLVAALYTGARESSFLTSDSFDTTFALLGILGLVALAQQIVVLTGGIDLSVGPLVSVLVVVASFFVTPEKVLGYQLAGVALLAAVALAVGVVNGVLAEVARIPAVIATLVTFICLQGVALLLRPTPAGTIDPAFTDRLATKVGPLPIVLIVAVVAAVALDVTIRRTRWGLALRAVGSDPDSAHRLGARVRWIRFSAYLAAAALVFVAAMFYLGQAGIGSADVGTDYTLTTITAVVLGGAAIGGGRGAFLGALAGAALIQVITSAIPFLQLSDASEQWLIGGLILVSALGYSTVKRMSATY